MQQNNAVIIEPYKQKIESWQANLRNLRNENNRLKFRLSEFLRSEKTCRFVEQAESFLNRFVLQDETLVILRHEVYMHEKQCQSFSGEEFESKHRTLGLEMSSVEEEFSRLSNGFQKFMEAHPKCFLAG
jgi:hypothetical protein